MSLCVSRPCSKRFWFSSDAAPGGTPLLRTWIEYYGRYAPSALHPVLRHVNQTLLAWARRKFKRFAAHKTLVSAYAGWYQLSDGSVPAIRPEENYLVARGRIITEGTLQPVSDHEFLRGTWRLRVSISPSTETGVELLRNGQVRQQGRQTPAERSTKAFGVRFGSAILA